MGVARQQTCKEQNIYTAAMKLELPAQLRN